MRPQKNDAEHQRPGDARKKGRREHEGRDNENERETQPRQGENIDYGTPRETLCERRFIRHLSLRRAPPLRRMATYTRKASSF
jgi:hypothetical protein